MWNHLQAMDSAKYSNLHAMDSAWTPSKLNVAKRFFSTLVQVWFTNVCHDTHKYCDEHPP